jgi:hypothetical protein
LPAEAIEQPRRRLRAAKAYKKALLSKPIDNARRESLDSGRETPFHASVVSPPPRRFSSPASSRTARPFALDPKNEHAEDLVCQNRLACGGARGPSAALSVIRRAPQEGQKPRRLQLKATSFSA